VRTTDGLDTSTASPGRPRRRTFDGSADHHLVHHPDQRHVGAPSTGHQVVELPIASDRTRTTPPATAPSPATGPRSNQHALTRPNASAAAMKPTTSRLPLVVAVMIQTDRRRRARRCSRRERLTRSEGSFKQASADLAVRSRLNDQPWLAALVPSIRLTSATRAGEDRSRRHAEARQVHHCTASHTTRKISALIIRAGRPCAGSPSSGTSS
jgi:hypothetical protein